MPYGCISWHDRQKLVRLDSWTPEETLPADSSSGSATIPTSSAIRPHRLADSVPTPKYSRATIASPAARATMMREGSTVPSRTLQAQCQQAFGGSSEGRRGESRRNCAAFQVAARNAGLAPRDSELNRRRDHPVLRHAVEHEPEAFAQP